MSLAWIYLIIAGIFEWGWPVGLKLAIESESVVNRWSWGLFSVGCLIVSFTMLYLALKSIPMGTAYAVWTGIGAFGAFIIGVLLFSEAATLSRFFFVALIVAGIIGLKLSSPQ